MASFNTFPVVQKIVKKCGASNWAGNCVCFQILRNTPCGHAQSLHQGGLGVVWGVNQGRIMVAPGVWSMQSCEHCSYALPVAAEATRILRRAIVGARRGGAPGQR